MAVDAIFIEGFDAVSGAGQLTAKHPGSICGNASTGAGRVRGTSMSYIGSGNNGFNHQLDPTAGGAAYSHLGIAFGFKPASQSLRVFGLRTGSGGGNGFSIDTNTGGVGLHLRTLRSSDSVLLADGTTVLSAGTWYFIEIDIVMSTTSGSLTVKINGVVEASLTIAAAQTSSTASATWAIWSVANATHSFDDIVIQNLATAGTALLGDCTVSVLRPSAAGHYAQFSPLSSTNVSNVDDAGGHDGDTSYNSDAAVGDRDSFAHDALPTNGTPYAVQTVLAARRDDAGARTMRTSLRDASASTDYDGAQDAVLTTAYLSFCEIWNSDPAGGAWTQANLEDDEIGYKVTA